MPWYDDYIECWTEGGTLLQEFMNSRKALLNDGAYIRLLLEYGYVLEHKTFALAINRDYFSTVFTSDHQCTI